MDITLWSDGQPCGRESSLMGKQILCSAIVKCKHLSSLLCLRYRAQLEGYIKKATMLQLAQPLQLTFPHFVTHFYP